MESLNVPLKISRDGSHSGSIIRAKSRSDSDHFSLTGTMNRQFMGIVCKFSSFLE